MKYPTLHYSTLLLAAASRRVGLGPGGDAPLRDARVAFAVAGAVERADDISEAAAVDTEVVEVPCVGRRRVGLGVVCVLCVWGRIKGEGGLVRGSRREERRDTRNTRSTYANKPT